MIKQLIFRYLKSAFEYEIMFPENVFVHGFLWGAGVVAIMTSLTLLVSIAVRDSSKLVGWPATSAIVSTNKISVGQH